MPPLQYLNVEGGTLVLGKITVSYKKDYRKAIIQCPQSAIKRLKTPAPPIFHRFVGLVLIANSVGLTGLYLIFLISYSSSHVKYMKRREVGRDSEDTYWPNYPFYESTSYYGYFL